MKSKTCVEIPDIYPGTGSELLDFPRVIIAGDDKTEWLKAITGGDTNLLFAAISAFLADMPEKMALLGDAIARKDKAAVGIQACNMQSSGTLMGLTVFSLLCGKLGRHVVCRGSGKKARELLTAVEEEYSGIARDMRILLSKKDFCEWPTLK